MTSEFILAVCFIAISFFLTRSMRLNDLAVGELEGMLRQGKKGRMMHELGLLVEYERALLPTFKRAAPEVAPAPVKPKVVDTYGDFDSAPAAPASVAPTNTVRTVMLTDDEVERRTLRLRNAVTLLEVANVV